jgi:hypothetical protein
MAVSQGAVLVVVGSSPLLIELLDEAQPFVSLPPPIIKIKVRRSCSRGLTIVLARGLKHADVMD